MTARNSISARMRFVGAFLILTLAMICRPATAPAQPTDPAPGQFSPGEAGTLEDAEAADGERRSAVAALPTNLVEIAQALDYWLIPFALATLIALWFSTERLVVLRRGRVIPKPFVERFLKHLEDGTLSKAEALEVCEENGSPVAQVFAHGVRKWGKPSVEVEQAIIDGGERQVAQLRSHLRVINGVATVTPLLGLLGTVWGMFEAFNDIAAAGSMGNTTVLASGIALALLTTAAGLVIAIPSLIVYMFLSGRVDSLVMDMDELSQNIVHTISAEALTDKRPRTTTPPRKKAAS
jgi:biopolymer transport protein ExbB